MVTFQIELSPGELRSLHLCLQDAQDRFAVAAQQSPDLLSAWGKVAGLAGGDEASVPPLPLQLTIPEGDSVGAALHEGLSSTSLITRGALSGMQGRFSLPKAYRDMDRATAEQWSQGAQSTLRKLAAGLETARQEEEAAAVAAAAAAAAEPPPAPWWRRILKG